MSGNTESSSNSIKFAPMPMSALLANLAPLRTQTDTPDSSFSSGDSDDSICETVANKTPLLKSHGRETKDVTSEKKIYCYNKENFDENWLSRRTYASKENCSLQGANKYEKFNPFPNSEVKKRPALSLHDNNIQTQENNIDSALKKTPEISKPPNRKTKSGTPIIKSGIRKFTPGSSRLSQKKAHLQNVLQNRDKVRCELFGQSETKDENPIKREQMAPPVSAPQQTPIIIPVPETPVNRKQIPAPCVATPSYPQGVIGNSAKILFKTTCIKDKKYMFIKKLGTGGSSEVYKVLEVGTSCEYAVKCVYLATDQELAQGYINEVRLLRELQNSDRVIRLYDYEYDRTNRLLRMVLEVGETDLSSFLRARGSGLPPALVLHYWEEMLLAVLYIHEHGVIHADLKPANFLLVCGRLKLIDFGIASAISGDATSVVRSQAAGTYSYISPEALMGGAGGCGRADDATTPPIKISFRSDVWSLGCILYSMVYGRTPFGHIPNLAKLAAILDPNHRIDYPPIDHFPPSLIGSLKWCLTYNMRARPSVRELLSVRHLQPPRAPLPQTLVEKVRPHLTPEEVRMLQRALV
ncbi:unnamed protein product [Parnassius apollo]|uniref:(apollo) hypothetical protein n=1 Tax=Parnassius apollo TaxID=110799 RepID=A0A8S3XPK7_PARAO|nr:unnamed protein product [Parnassius apollo]